MTKDEALDLALEALEASEYYINDLEAIVYAADDLGTDEDRTKMQEAITAIKQALAAPVQEPVAMTFDEAWASLSWQEWRMKSPQAVFKELHRLTAPPAQPAPVQEPKAWPCLIAEADFSQNTITLTMQCEDYKVSARQHWLSTTPPAAQPAPVPLTHEQISAIGSKIFPSTWNPRHVEFAKAIEAAHGITKGQP